jgi:hypothetical protein
MPGVLEELLDTVRDLKDRDERLEEQLQDLAQIVHPKQSWFTFDECCALKGVAKNTVKNHRALMPPHGVKVGRVIRYPAVAVFDWCRKTDQELEDEHRKIRGSRSAS